MTDTPKPSAWDRWKDLAGRAATFQARILLAMFYWTMLAPFALLSILTDDTLEVEGTDGGRWHRTPESEPRAQY